MRYIQLFSPLLDPVSRQVKGFEARAREHTKTYHGSHWPFCKPSFRKMGNTLVKDCERLGVGSHVGHGISSRYNAVARLVTMYCGARVMTKCSVLACT